MYDLLNLFLSVLAKESAVVSRIEDFQGQLYIEQGCLIFSLSALHEFLNQSSEEKTTYQDFQRQLYQSTLNQDLKPHGAQVVVHHSTGKVETNLYRLERLPTVDKSL
jgi:hypothetical protein